MKDIRIFVASSKELEREAIKERLSVVRKGVLAMKLTAAAILFMFMLTCSEKRDEVFSLEKANKCLLESDKDAVHDAVEWIKKAEATEDDKKSVEYFGKVYDPINELYTANRDDDSLTGRKRSAALAWVLVDFSYNPATGSCAKWVLFAQRLGLLEAHQMVANSPEKLRSCLLPSGRQ